MNTTELKKMAEAATPGPWRCVGFRVTAKELGYARVADTEFDNESMAENAAYIASAPPAPHAEQHPDDMAVERFAAAMKDKLATARQKGRGGWEYCDVGVLSGMLREHVEKGDPRDVANFCMFLWSLGHGIAPQASVVQQEPIYQYQLADGAWVDQIEDSYKYNQAHGAKNIRIVYTHPVQRTKPQPLSDERALEIFNDLEKFMDQIEEEDISDERLAGKSMQFILDRIAAMKGAP